MAIDLDPQANLSQALMREGYKEFLEDGEPSIVEIFRGYRPPSKSAGAPGSLHAADVVHRVGSSNLSLIPSRFDFEESLVESLPTDPRTLARFVSESFSDLDLILIDCAPTESVLTRAAYGASRYVLVPVRPEYFATIGFRC